MGGTGVLSATLQRTSLAGLPIRTRCPACARPLEHRHAEGRGQFAVCDRNHAHHVAGLRVETGAGDPHVKLRLGRRVR
jgi:hypothetical protein